MELTAKDRVALDQILVSAKKAGLDVRDGRMRRTSSRFCFGIEHGDYNGTELFGVATDRFIWLAFKPNGTDRSRFFSVNFPDDGVIAFRHGEVPQPKSEEVAETWGRFAYGVDYILRREGLAVNKGIEAVIYGDIPGGGMSRSASLTLNIILSLLEANSMAVENRFRLVDLAQAVENDYIGSPCGRLDQVMILFSKAGMGTLYNPASSSITHVPLGEGAPDFRIVGLDTGTERPGLEKSTYRVRRAECERLVSILQEAGYDIRCLADIKDDAFYRKIIEQFRAEYPDLCDRLDYIFHAQKRFTRLLEAWKAGDIATVGEIFREDGIGLRDDYKISGPELETMCDIARTVPGVFGERMLGGGDKGASGALVASGSVKALQKAVNTAYPRSHPACKDKYGVHVLKMVEGVQVYDGLLGS